MLKVATYIIIKLLSNFRSSLLFLYRTKPKYRSLRIEEKRWGCIIRWMQYQFDHLLTQLKKSFPKFMNIHDRYHHVFLIFLVCDISTNIQNNYIHLLCLGKVQLKQNHFFVSTVLSVIQSVGWSDDINMSPISKIFVSRLNKKVSIDIT